MAREIAATFFVLVGASLVLFFILKAAPSDDSRSLRLDMGAGEGARPEIAHEADQGPVREYAKWLGSAVKGDFGNSQALQKGRPAIELLKPATGTSYLLLATGIFFSAVMGLFVSILRTFRSYNPFYRLLAGVSGFFSALPVFLFVYVFVAGGNRLILWGVGSGYWDRPAWFPLPVEPAFWPWLCAALILAVGDGGLIDLVHRFRSELNHARSGDYMTGVRMLNISVPGVITRGFIPGALSHITRRISFYLGSLVVLEAALGWPGLGYLAWRAAAERDMPVLLGAAMIMAVTLRLVLVLSDLVGYAADPRRRLAK